MMQFTQVGDDAYDVRMNLDAIKRISENMTSLTADGVDERNQAIATGFGSAYNKFSQPSEETE
jgi:hypothetical protein